MSSRLKFALMLAGLFLFVVGVLAAALRVVWSQLGIPEQDLLARALDQYSGVVLVFAALLLVGLGLILEGFFKAYVSPAARLAEGTQLILTANPRHRLAQDGTSEIRQLACAINALAERCEDLRGDVEAKIQASGADLAEEKNRLAALMSELAQSVLVCNSEGRILLYNARAGELLGQKSGPNEHQSGFLGLGRSIFGLLERGVIVHALDHIRHRLGEGNADAVSQFVTAGRGGQLIRAHMAPVLNQQREISGFVLTMEDVTRTMEAVSGRDALLQALTETTRASLANIRAAIETLLDYPDMVQEQRNRFTTIIRDEAVALSTRLDRTWTEFSAQLKTQWPLEEMLGADLVSALRRRLETRWGAAVTLDIGEDPVWLTVDSYSLVQAFTCLVGRLRESHGIREIGLGLRKSGRFAQLDLAWNGAPIDPEVAQRWENEPLVVEQEGTPLTLKEVAERHGGEEWYRVDRESGAAHFRFLLPLTEPRPARSARIRPESRPEYYDFDLFSQPGQSAKFDDRPLKELAYTVFDTETTGLRPSEGDEIISISAVRIVNGRLLQHENFDQLIDPQRTLSRQSVRIHGIRPEMLKGQPTIKGVLPRFFKFAEDTVLVAHNAAFDMRFLQLKEDLTGIKFSQPVLDTLLLSAVVHPNLPNHELEANAERFGVDITGRHTSLGDAIVTGEIFLRLVPLLAEQGIRTLKDAREASQKTYLARLEY